MEPTAKETKSTKTTAKGREHKDYGKYVKVVITSRDAEEMKADGYAKLNNYSIQWQWEEEIEIPEKVVEFLKSKGTKYTDSDGEVRFKPRWIVERV